MGPGRSSSLRIGDDSSVVVSTGRAGGASGRSAIFEPQNAAEAPPLPFDEGKEKINLITYPGGGRITLNLPLNMLRLWGLVRSTLRMGVFLLNVIDLPLVSEYGSLMS